MDKCCIYENAIKIADFNCLNKVFSFISFIPNIYMDAIYSGNKKNIFALHKIIYRYYGIENNHTLIGFVHYSIPTDNIIVTLDNIEVFVPFRSKGLGTILLNQSLEDIVNDFPYLEKMNVCSLNEDTTRFYRNNGFEIYLGDNCLTKKLVRK